MTRRIITICMILSLFLISVLSTSWPQSEARAASALNVLINKGNGVDNTQQTGFNFLVQNTGTSALSSISTRIYFTPDGSNAASSYVLEKYYDQSGVASVSGPTLACGSTYYFTVSYGTSSLAAGAQWEFQTALHLSSWGNSFSSANDYFHSGYATGSLPAAYTATTSIPGYLNSVLSAGSTPDCGSGASATPTLTATRTATVTPTNTGPTPTRTRTPTVTLSRTSTRTNTPGTPTATSTRTVTPTNTISATPSVTPTSGTGNVGNATWFSALGSPYGGCGITQSALDSQNFIALNVQNSPGDYTTFHPRPLAPEFASVIGTWNNGLNCGRWVKVTISDYCNGVNDGAQNQPFCRGGTGYVADQYNGATLDMIVADSCYDSNAWCRDDPYHIDLAQASLNLFVKNGAPVGNMSPDHWNNRHVQWQYEAAPNYSGDINIGFIQGAQIWWTPIAITHLLNGIHGVDYYNGSAWVKATMDGDMGQSYLIGPTVSGSSSYQIRVYDVNDQLINNGRIYNFSLPASCGSQCSSPYTQVTYTIQ